VARHATAANWPDTTVAALKLAADEACTNVIEHAYEGHPGHTVIITIVVAPDRFVIRVRDTGKPFDRSSYVEPNLEHLTKEGKDGGLGVHIIRRLMDHVEYREHNGVNEIYLVKHRVQ